MAKVKEWLTGPSCSIYSCHFLASWSGRMFAFSLGLFLIDVSPDSLQLTATHGLCIGAAVLLLASLLGDWVDRTPRLKAALMSMILQNCLMTSCAGVLLLLLVLQSELGTMVSWLRHLFFAIIISLSVSSRLMKVARVIVVERDWIVEISKKDEDHLAVMTSTFRRIDLLTKILAPIVTGQIMTYAGLKIGAGFIAVWSLTSLGAEFWLIRRVYSFVPALRSKKIATRFSEKNNDQNRGATEKLQDKEVEKEPDREYRRDAEHTQPPRADDNKCSPWRVLDSFLVLYRGFRTYMSYEVKWAGFGLACLYLTVLGFDGITVGYATTQGLSGSVLGIMVGVGAVFGILATFAYPYIVRCLGLPRTGVLALGLQVSCLSLCVISVWLPGSPFYTNSSCLLGTANVSSSPSPQLTTTGLNVTGVDSLNNLTACSQPDGSRISVWVMLIGIVTARFGLWTADLTIIQLFLESVRPTERGIVNGFQSSLNQLMDFFKYALVVAIPYPPQFWLLILISFTFICSGWTCMSVYALKSSRRKTEESGVRLERHARLERESDRV